MISLATLIIMMPGTISAIPVGAEEEVVLQGLLSYGNLGTNSMFAGIIIGLLTFAGYTNTGVACDSSTLTIINNVADYTGQVVYRQMGGVENVLAFAFLGMEVITFAIIVFMMSRLDVEKHIEEDHRIIKENQKAAVLAAGGTWEE